MKEKIEIASASLLHVKLTQLLKERADLKQRFGATVFAVLQEPGKADREIFLGHNIVVPGMGILVAQLVKDCSAVLAGFSFMGVGTGGTGEDPFNPPAPLGNETLLKNEIFRKGFSSVNFVDANGLPVLTPTNTVDFAATFTETEAVGPLTELGIFGGDATATPNSGTMVNYIRFPVVSKTATSTLTLVVRFVFAPGS